jgi:hypothetical protein
MDDHSVRVLQILGTSSFLAGYGRRAACVTNQFRQVVPNSQPMSDTERGDLHETTSRAFPSNGSSRDACARRPCLEISGVDRLTARVVSHGRRRMR